MGKYRSRKDPEETVQAVRHLVEGTTKTPAEIAAELGLKTVDVSAIVTRFRIRRAEVIQFPDSQEERVEVVCAMLRKGIAQAEIAMRLGLSPGYIENWSNRSIKLSDKHRKKLATARKQGVKYKEMLLMLRVKTLLKKGCGVKQMREKLHARNRLDKMAGSMNFKVNTERILMLRKKDNLIDREKIVEDYKTGICSAAMLARKYGLANSTVAYILGEAGLKVVRVLGNGNPENLRKYAEVQHLRNLGWTYRQIAEFQGVAVSSVRKRASILKKKQEEILSGATPPEFNNVKLLGVYKEIFDMLSEGVRQSEIACRTGYTKQHINHIAKGRFVMKGVVQ